MVSTESLEAEGKERGHWTASIELLAGKRRRGFI